MTYNPKKSNNTKKRGTGRLANLPKISTYEAKQEALLMIRRGRVTPSSKLYHTIALLGTTGVLTEEHLLEIGNVTGRTLRNYRQKGILDIVPTPKSISELLKTKRIWALGPIGIQLSKIQLELVPTGYLESKIDNISHDVLCNSVYIEIWREAEKKGYTAILKSRYEASIKDFRNTPVLQPDAMIILQDEEGGEKTFVVEYHNEDFGSRAGEKIRKYEHIYREGYWRDQWHVKTFPPILIVTTHRAPAVGYNDEIKKHLKGEGVKCTYLIKPLRALLDGNKSPLVWLNLEKNRSINILKM